MSFRTALRWFSDLKPLLAFPKKKARTVEAPIPAQLPTIGFKILGKNGEELSWVQLLIQIFSDARYKLWQMPLTEVQSFLDDLGEHKEQLEQMTNSDDKEMEELRLLLLDMMHRAQIMVAQEPVDEDSQEYKDWLVAVAQAAGENDEDAVMWTPEFKKSIGL